MLEFGEIGTFVMFYVQLIYFPLLYKLANNMIVEIRVKWQQSLIVKTFRLRTSFQLTSHKLAWWSTPSLTGTASCRRRRYWSLEYLTMQTCKDRRVRILVGNKVDLERSRQVSAKGENYQDDMSPAWQFQRGRTWPPCLTASS